MFTKSIVRMENQLIGITYGAFQNFTKSSAITEETLRNKAWPVFPAFCELESRHWVYCWGIRLKGQQTVIARLTPLAPARMKGGFPGAVCRRI